MTEKERLDQLEPLVADIALKQDRMLGQIGMIVDQVSLHTVRLDDLTRRANATDKKIDALASGLANLTLDVSKYHQRFDQLELRQTKLEENQNRLEQRFDRFETRMENFETRMEKFETRMEKMEQNQELIVMLLKQHLK